jgi:hypothetical protein
MLNAGTRVKPLLAGKRKSKKVQKNFQKTAFYLLKK